MALPKIGIPYYTLELISGNVIQYRPFTVKEEKALIMANESKDRGAISNAIRNTLNACIMPEEGSEPINVENFPMFDVELLFLNIRMRSVGEFSEFNYTCSECEGNPVVKTKLDLRSVRVENADYANTDKAKIMLTDDIGIEVNYPPFRTFLGKNGLTEKSANNPIVAIDMIADCISSVYDKDQVHTRKDFTEREIREFVDSLTQEQLKKINQFFENMPKLVYDLSVECPCGVTETKQLEGISDFFS